jgi:hypothetical protein
MGQQQIADSERMERIFARLYEKAIAADKLDMPLPGLSWLQGPTNALGISVDLDAIRARLQNMNEAELLAFGRQMRSLVYPLTYGSDGKPSVSAFSIQLDEARAEWRQRKASV